MKKVAFDERISFFGHLDELRKRIINSFIALIGGFLAGYLLCDYFIKLIKKPLPPEFNELIFLTPSEPFFVAMKISFYIGLVISFPIIFSQIWGFISPGLLESEKKYGIFILILGPVFFLIGGIFSYFLIIPSGLKFLLNYGVQYGRPNITLNNYLSFCTSLILASGLIFQIPLILGVLGKIGIITSSALRRNRRFAILIAFILGAVLTPTPDIVNQTMVALPAVILYELSILIIKMMERGRDRTDL